MLLDEIIFFDTKILFFLRGKSVLPYSARLHGTNCLCEEPIDRIRARTDIL